MFYGKSLFLKDLVCYSRDITLSSVEKGNSEMSSNNVHFTLIFLSQPSLDIVTKFLVNGIADREEQMHEQIPLL